MRQLVIIQHERDIPPGTITTHAQKLGATIHTICAWEADAIARIDSLSAQLRACGTRDAAQGTGTCTGTGTDAAPETALPSPAAEVTSPAGTTSTNWCTELTPTTCGIIVLGGRENAYSDTRWPWIGPTKNLIRAAIDTNTPYLGVCLGMQLLAVTLGGEVKSPSPKGPEYGPTRLHSGLVVYEDHEDGVHQLPHTVEVLDSSNIHPQVIRYASATGVQYHPEVTPSIVADFIADNDRINDKKALLNEYEAHAEAISAHCADLVHSLLKA